MRSPACPLHTASHNQKLQGLEVPSCHSSHAFQVRLCFVWLSNSAFRVSLKYSPGRLPFYYHAFYEAVNSILRIKQAITLTVLQPPLLKNCTSCPIFSAKVRKIYSINCSLQSQSHSNVSPRVNNKYLQTLIRRTHIKEPPKLTNQEQQQMINSQIKAFLNRG